MGVVSMVTPPGKGLQLKGVQAQVLLGTTMLRDE